MTNKRLHIIIVATDPLHWLHPLDSHRLLSENATTSSLAKWPAFFPKCKVHRNVTLGNMGVHIPNTATFFEVKETPNSGRAVFALQDLPKGTLLLETRRPTAWVIYVEYAKEVCARCFAYDRGKVWKIKEPSMGVSFCSVLCHEQWVSETPSDHKMARIAVHGLLARKRKVSEVKSCVLGENHWDVIESVADEIRRARYASTPTRKERKAIQAAQEAFVSGVEDPYVVWYMLSGLLAPPTLLAPLALDSAPYKTPLDLLRATQSYLALLAVVPIPLLPMVTQDSVRNLHMRSSHNVFGLRCLDEGGEVAGSECFGYGLWPDASLWNHSCDPNVGKRRDGEKWRFWCAREVKKGEELCISYLGGDEWDLGRDGRWKVLQGVWGFVCGCERCEIGDDEKAKELSNTSRDN